MARLTIEQIRAPDLSVASQATARAGEAFQRGMSSASDLLSQYQEGLESQGDAELTNLLAGAKNEDEWNSIVAGTDFANMNLSAGMRQQIIDRRDNVLGYEQARATRAGTDASTGLTVANTGLVGAQTTNTLATADRTRNATRIDTNQDNRAGDIHGVTMADHAWRQGARAEDASMAGLALAAAAEGTTNGYQSPASGLVPENVSGLYQPPETNVGPRADGSGLAIEGDVRAQVYNGMIQRGIPEQVAQGFMMNFEDESGFNIDITEAEDNVHGTRGKGIYQLTGARRDAFEARYGNDYSIDNQLDFMMDELNGSERGARDAIWGAGSAGEAGAAIVSRFLRPAEEHRVNRTNSYLQTSGDTTAFTRDRANVNPNQGAGPATQAYQTALANSRFQSTADVLAAYERNYDYAETGQAAITAEDARLGEEALAQQILDVAATNVDPTEAIVEARRSNPGATAVERLQNEAAILEATGDGGALSAARLQIGTTGASPADIGRADATLGVITEELQRDPFTRAHMNAEEFESDPAASMTSALEGLNISTTPADVQSAINAMAEDLSITPGQAAYAYARAAEQESRMGRFLSIGGDNLSNNAAYDYARENFTGDRGREARNDIANARRRAEQVQMATSDLGRVERRIQKLRQQGDTVPASLMSERDELAAALQSLYQEFGGGTPAQPSSAAAQLQAAVPSAG